jgi:diaminopimelate decarboxylase
MPPFSYHNGRLHCEGVPLPDIAAAVGTPVYIYSQAELSQRAGRYRQAAAAASARHLVCYALKANNNPTLLRLLAEAGLGADVTSGGELFLAGQAGFAPEKTIFSGVGKTRAEIEAALTTAIRALHVESAMELAVVREVAASHGQTAAIGLRLNPNVSAATHPHISTGRQSHKFGVDLEQAIALLRQAADDPWLRPVGLAAHIGSQIADLAPFVTMAEILCAAASELAAAGILLEYLDVGGGLAIDYAGEAVPEVEQWVTAVAKPVAAAGYELVMEPGRSLVGPAGALLTQVLYTKQQGQQQFVICDAGMTELIRPALYDAQHPIWPVVQRPGARMTGARMTAEVVGPVCETGDYLGRERSLPAVQAGDWLAVLQAGAYGFAMSSNYNGRLRPAEVLVNVDQFQLIRRRQTREQLLDNTQ